LFYHKYKTDLCDLCTRREITMQQRASIKFYVKLDKTFTKILAMLWEIYGDKAL